MIIVIRNNANPQDVQALQEYIRSLGLTIHQSVGASTTVLGLVGDTGKVDIDLIRSIDTVESVTRVQEPYKNANRKFHPQDTVVTVGGHRIGGGAFAVIAGPCSVETPQQITSIAQSVKEGGAALLRGGAFKPRSSPYSFQGLGEEGLRYLLQAKKATGMPVVSELMSIEQLPLFDDVDVIQIGARNMQNFTLLKAVGKLRKPILLKRGLANTIEEWLMSAEYIMSEGNEQVILCERGIRTFETATRNTLDLGAIAVLKEKTHLPVVVDPSHALGVSRYVEPMCLAAAAAGADGLLIEVHNDPAHAWCDGQQSIRPEVLADIVTKLDKILPVVGKVRDL